MKTNPSGNTTILVLDPVNPEEHSRLAPLLMDKNSLFAEQVAFLDSHPPRFCDIAIRMMGGEFCGNAVRSAAAWLVFDRSRWQPSLEAGNTASFEVSCTGFDQNVVCTVRQLGRHQFDVAADMPLPYLMQEMDVLGHACWQAKLPGITHHCFFEKGSMPEEEKAKLICAARTCDAEASAVGILFWDGHTLDPYVYVKDTGTLVHESSCGSGTAAVAACLAGAARGSVHIDALQQGGLIYADAQADQEGQIQSLRIGGLVEITAEGIAYL